MKFKKELLIAFLHLASVFGAPSSTESLVTISSEAHSTNELAGGDGIQKVPKIYSMKVDTNVTNRFATSLVTSKVKNLDANPQEATFSVVLPDTAYISGFIMEIDGKKYEAYVQEKEEAKRTYNQAVSSGFAAGHVAINARDSNKFTVSVNIMPESKATFYLKYEELLTRQKGLYDIVINLHPGQPVKDMEVQVNINETRPLTSVTTPSLRSGNEISKNNEILDPKAEIERIGNNSAKIVFQPNIIRQKEIAKELGTEEENGFAGQFVVQYDVERDPQGGELLFADGFFVHFFAPKDAKPEPKQITFVLDTSGSMWGTRISQLKEAMKSIIDQLSAEDSFNIIDFNSLVNVWNVPNAEVQYEEGEVPAYYNHKSKTNRSDQILPGSFEVSAKNIEKAKQLVDSLTPSGATNIDLALDIALKLHKKNKEKDERQPIIMFLTDGEATEGETNSDAILSKITKKNTDGIPIISISFGDRADKKFLEKLSLRNQGFARHIYEGADAALQLKSLYEIISTPLFNKIHFEYVSENISEVTKTRFPILFDGSELVVAGKYKTPFVDPGFYPRNSLTERFEVLPLVHCLSESTPKEFKPTLARPVGSLEKHWAYLTLKQILKERDVADKKEELTKKALALALKYSFVTPVSSLVVVKPNETKSETDLQDASTKGHPSRSSFIKAASYRPPFSGYNIMTPQSYSGNRQFDSYLPLQTRPIPRGPPIPAGYGYESMPVRVVFSQNRHPAFPASSMDPSFLNTIDMRVPPRSSFFDSSRCAESFYSTTAATKLTTEIEKLIPDATIERMKKDLTWFEGVYNAENGTINLVPLGSFSLGGKDQITKPYPECPKTPLNGTGHCVLLRNCPQVHHLLNPITSYIQYFCPLGKFAGVCCPINIEKDNV